MSSTGEAGPARSTVPDAADVRVPRFDHLREQLFGAVARECIPSLAVGVAQRGEILWQESFGWADRDLLQAATSRTMFSLASLSKPITATALMVLVERGAIDLDAPINEYLDGATLTARVGEADQATVRRVANHTSGLPLHCRFYRPGESPAVAKSIARYGNLVSVPGEHYQYSNLGYGLLDRAIATASGVAFADFVRSEVFEPLGMHDSAVHLRQGDVARAATRYHPNGSALPHYTTDHAGASEVYCSIADLLRFGMFHVGERSADHAAPISTSTVRQMQASTARIDDHMRYGIGWRIAEVRRCPRTVGHRGGMPGVSSELLLFPAEQLVIGAVSNATGNVPLPYRAVADVVELILGDGACRPSLPGGDRGLIPARRPPPGLVGEWEGCIETYDGTTGLRLSVHDSGAVEAKLEDQPEQVVHDLEVRGGRLAGAIAGTLDTSDTREFPLHLAFDLAWRGEVLNGALIAVGDPERHGRYDVRGAFSLSYWAELIRAKSGRKSSNSSPR